ncbi:hypothetical protein [Roseateles sp.]|nr:hypothetical protein [Roseateles sp.]
MISELAKSEPFGQSLAFALAFVAVWALIVRELDSRNRFFKV